MYPENLVIVHGDDSTTVVPMRRATATLGSVHGGHGLIALQSFGRADPQVVVLYAFVPREGDRPHVLQQLASINVGRFVPDLDDETPGLAIPPFAPNVARPARLAFDDDPEEVTVDVFLGRRIVRITGFGKRLAKSLPGLQQGRDQRGQNTA